MKYVLYRILLQRMEYVLAEKWMSETAAEMPAAFLGGLFVRISKKAHKLFVLPSCYLRLLYLTAL